MLLPTKGISPDRALLTIGSDLLIALRRPTTVSALWDRFNASKSKDGSGRITFDWFSLALATLYSLGLIEITPDGYLRRRRNAP